MPMRAESLEVLEGADVPPSQARAIVRAIEIEITGASETLATKHDLLLLKQEISELRAELKAEISQLRTEVKAEISELREEVKAEISGIRGEVRAEISGLRGELRAEIHASASSVSRQMYAALLGQMAVLLGIAYFFTTHVR